MLIGGAIAAFTCCASAATWSTTDLKTNAALPSGMTTWNSVSVTWQVGNYISLNNVQVYGLLCIPSSLPVPYPVAIVNHGLATVTPPFPGIAQTEWEGCIQMAGNGWLTAYSAYRGETISGLPPPYANFSATSGGVVQLCLDEVDDVLNLLSAVTAMPNANANHVLMWGHSHGACITERAIERGAAVQVAVSLDGPTDFTTWIKNPFPSLAAQQERSSALPMNSPIALTHLRFLRIQAEGDQIVQPAQACELAAQLSGSVNYHIDSGVTPYGVYYAAPTECAPYPMPWVNAPHGANGLVLPDETAGGMWASPTLLMYSGLDHVTIMGKSWTEQASFVNDVATSANWHASLPSEFIMLDSE